MEITNYCKDHNCIKCGSCCGMCIPITRKEEKVIRKYIKENNITPETLITETDFYAHCCFYDRTNKLCKIYEVRPNICRSFKCDRNPADLLKERDSNHRKAYWNSVGKDGRTHHVTSFDLLFYDNPEPILRMIWATIPGKNDEKKYDRFIRILQGCDLGEVADHLVPYYEDEEDAKAN